jgi:hypothetical protein
VAAGGGSGGHGACKRGQRRGEIGPGQGESDAWRPIKQEVERQRWPGRSGSEEQESRGVPEEEEEGAEGPRDSFAKPESLGTSR